MAGRASGGAGGADIASSRPYRPGDHVRNIDWKTSARLSSARNGDEFIVRERFSDEMPAVILVADRRPAMQLYPPELPWLSKPEAVLTVSRILVASALVQRSLVGYLDLATHDGGPPVPRSGSPRGRSATRGRPTAATSAASTPTVRSTRPRTTSSARWSSSPRCDGRCRSGRSSSSCPTSSLRSATAAWAEAIDEGWDVVPVVVQDPIWEQSFPRIDGVRVLLADALEEQARYVRLNEVDVAERRKHNEQRLAGLRTEFARLGLDTIVIGDAHFDAVQAALLAWSHARLAVRASR